MVSNFLLPVSMTVTVPLTMFVTKTLTSVSSFFFRLLSKSWSHLWSWSRLFSLMATHQGSFPTGISATFWFASLATKNTDTELLSGFTLQTNWLWAVIAMGLEVVANLLPSL